MTTVGLMGFGRIGRNIFRQLYRREDLKIGAIADLASPEGLEYLLRFDSLLGRFPDEVRVREGNLYVIGRQVPMLAAMERGAIPPWGELGVDIVLDATARKLGRADLTRHLAAGAKRVILCSAPLDAVDLSMVRGINDQELKKEHRVVSALSSTVHAAAPVLKILVDAFGVQQALFTTIHNYTNQHRLADVPGEDKRRGRAAAENIIPQDSRSAGLLADLIPELSGRLIGAAMNVPCRNSAVVDLACWHDRKVSVTAVNEVVRTAAASRWKGIVGFETEPIVSSDVAMSSFSGIFDAQATMVLGERVSKTLTWFDDGWGYAQRVVEMIEHFDDLDRAEAA